MIQYCTAILRELTLGVKIGETRPFDISPKTLLFFFDLRFSPDFKIFNKN